MNQYLSLIIEQLGISLWFFILILTWELVWKLIALWKSARKKHVAWFIVLALLNTMGILPILYIFVFSKMKCKTSSRTRRVKKRIKRGR